MVLEGLFACNSRASLGSVRECCYTLVQRSNFELRFPVLVSTFSAKLKSILTMFVDRQENVLMAILGVKFTRFGIIFPSIALPLVLLFLSV